MGMRPPIGLPVMSRRGKRVLIAIVSLALIAVLWFQFVGLYVDFSWFREVGFTQVFTTQLQSRAVLFLVAALGAGGLVLLALTLAYRSRPFFVPTDEVDPLAPYRSIISARPRLIAIVLSSVVGLICGLSAQNSWTTVQLWLHSTSFGQTDAQFGHDIGFYVFTLPMIELVLGWLFAIIALCFIAVVVVQYIYGGIRVSGPGRKITSAATLQLSLLVGAFVLVKAVQYWFDQYSLLFSNRGGQFTGASYTDVNAVLPAKLILMCIAAICAIGFIVGGFLRSVKLPAIALALLVLSSVLIGGAWPLVLQNVRVNPNAISLEPEYISKNIAATRDAYDIGDDKVTYSDYQEQSSDPNVVLKEPDGLPNARLLDPNVLGETFIQLKQFRNFYSFASPLTVDRYTVNGTTQDYVVGLREINVGGLQDNQKVWINEHLVYTHGNGIIAAPASQVAATITGGSGTPAFQESSVQEQNFIPVDQPRIYYGQLGTDYAIVGAEPGQAPREYDTDSTTYTYTGSGGVSVGNLFQRMIFATKYGEWNFLFSSEINSGSKIMYNRDPAVRVKEVAPFLTIDSKPYPAVVNKRIVWIVDGYTTATNYPYAQNVSLADATANSLQTQGSAQAASQQVSYMRNSVKATVDAYDGSIKLYGVDDQDPILKAWEGVFPNLISPASEISDELRAHFRYPQDLFEVQRSLLAKYQVTNPVEFYQNSNFWQVPDDPTSTSAAPQPPYYLQIRLPDYSQPDAKNGPLRFELTSALTGFKRQFMGAYITASSDPSNYGQLNVLRFPTDTQTYGPAQVQTAFRGSSEITNLISLAQQSRDVIYGNLLTLPTADGLLYVEPIYLQGREANAYPQLNVVLVWFGKRVGFGATLEEALKKAAASAPIDVGENVPTTPIDPGATGSGQVTSTAPPGTGVPGTTPPVSTVPLSPDAQQALVQVQEALSTLNQVKTTGSFADVGAAQDRFNAAVQNYLEVAGPGAVSTLPSETQGAITSTPSASLTSPSVGGTTGG
ncbi:membrane protein [Nakamurella silvestris]|nr:membrane protein [Nakamurella silvestris]